MDPERPIPPLKAQLEFYDQCAQKFEDALSKTAAVKKNYRIANTTVCILFAGEALIHDLTAALAHLEVSSALAADFTIKVWDSQSSGVEMIPPPCPWSDFTDRGDVWGYGNDHLKMAYHWSEFSLNIMNCKKREAVYWVKTNQTFPYWVSSSPFRSLFAWWMEMNNAQLLHAAAVGTEAGAVVITGKGGVGKSSTAIKGLEGGMYYLADDYLVIQFNPQPVVYSLYSSAKLMTDDIVKYPLLKPYLSDFFSEEQEKGVFFLYPSLKEQIKVALPLKAILTPQIEKQDESTVEAIDPVEISRALAFTTMSQLPYSGVYTHDFVRKLVECSPTGKLKLGQDKALLLGLLQQLSRNPDSLARNSKNDEPKEDWPLISVIIPIYNGEQFAQQAISHVFEQNYPAIEVIVVDDGSTDSTRQAVLDAPYDVRYFYQPNAGPAAARNRGIRDAAGEYIAFLDVDDHWPKHTLHHLVNKLRNQTDMDLAKGYGQLCRWDENGKLHYIGNPKESFLDYIGAAVYRASVFSKVGLFDEDMTYGEDEDWFNRARENDQVNILKVDELTLMVLRHDSNMTQDKDRVQNSMLRIFKKTLDRKRQRIAAGYEDNEKELPSSIVKKKPAVSVIILANEEIQNTKQALELVESWSYQPLEIIVIGPGQPSFNGVDHLQFIVSEADPIDRLNQAIELSKGPYLYFYDPGCQLEKSSFHKLVGLLELNASFSFIKGYAQIENEPTIALHPSLCIFRKAIFMEIGFLRSEMKSASWLDWFFRFRESGKPLPFYTRKITKKFDLLEIDSSDRAQAQNASERRSKNIEGLESLPFPQKDYGEEVVKYFNQNKS